MKKIPTLFERVFENHKIIEIHNKITPGCKDAFRHGVATVKLDGACCKIINGEFYKRYDAKVGKRQPPLGAIPCGDPDPIAGHWPHWVKCNRTNPDDKWFWKAYDRAMTLNDYQPLEDGTYEACGPRINGNPQNFANHYLYKHGQDVIHVERTFNGVKTYLEQNYIEGIVFWLDGKPVCKIKRSDFGIPWGK